MTVFVKSIEANRRKLFWNTCAYCYWLAASQASIHSLYTSIGSERKFIVAWKSSIQTEHWILPVLRVFSIFTSHDLKREWWLWIIIQTQNVIQLQYKNYYWLDHNELLFITSRGYKMDNWIGYPVLPVLSSLAHPAVLIFFAPLYLCEATPMKQNNHWCINFYNLSPK